MAYLVLFILNNERYWPLLKATIYKNSCWSYFYLTWDEVARHSIDIKLICALFSLVKLKDVRSLIAHFFLKPKNATKFWVPSCELLVLWSSWPPLWTGPCVEVVVRTPKGNSHFHSSRCWLVFSLSLNLFKEKTYKLKRREIFMSFLRKLGSKWWCGKFLLNDRYLRPVTTLNTWDVSISLLDWYWVFGRGRGKLILVIGNTCVHAQSCLSLCDPMDCSLSGFSIHGIF